MEGRGEDIVDIVECFQGGVGGVGGERLGARSTAISGGLCSCFRVDGLPDILL